MRVLLPCFSTFFNGSKKFPLITRVPDSFNKEKMQPKIPQNSNVKHQNLELKKHPIFGLNPPWSHENPTRRRPQNITFHWKFL